VQPPASYSVGFDLDQRARTAIAALPDSSPFVSSHLFGVIRCHQLVIVAGLRLLNTLL
jgi:hypothetical protein